MAIASICAVAFLLTLLSGRYVIPALRALHAGQSIRDVGPSWHQGKQGTPTMGGVMFIFTSVLCVLAAGLMRNDVTHLYPLGFALICGAIGFADDFVKVKKKRNLGLTSLQKLALQLAAAGCYLALLRWSGHLHSALYVPFWNITVTIPWTLYLIFSVLLIVGFVNAVNLTDGVDGLATGVTIPVMAFFAVAAVLMKRTELSFFPAALASGLCGFLCYNAHPAKVFMGDTGSLFLGGAVCAMVFALDMPVLLLLVGVIYLMEAVSVMMQVAYFKITHGKRIFRMTPIHHHFEMCGWSENKIMLVFMTVTLVACVLSFFGIRGKF